MDNFNSIIYPNVHEYMKRGMGPFPGKLLAEWRRIAAGYGEVSLLWPGKNKLVMSPQVIDKDLIEYQRDAWKMGEISIVTPTAFTSETSKDFLQDTKAISKIQNFVNRHATTEFIPWGATSGVYDILKAINSPKLVSHEIPKEQNYWSSLYYDSKIGFKELCHQIGLKVPQGYVCDNLNMAFSIIKKFSSCGKECVLKANMGAGGFGNVHISKEIFSKSSTEIEAYVYKSIEEMPYFKEGAILVEEWIEPPIIHAKQFVSLYSGFASAEILPDGNIKIIGGGIDAHDHNGYYNGAKLGKEVFPDSLWNYLKNILEKLGAAISENGYRGHWGINYMLRANGEPVLIELNARRCGESHIHNIGRILAGENWMDTLHVISRFPMEVSVDRDITVCELLDLFDKRNKKYKNALIVPVQLSWLKKERYKGIGYMILGDTDEVEKQDCEMRRDLAMLGIKEIN